MGLARVGYLTRKGNPLVYSAKLAADLVDIIDVMKPTDQNSVQKAPRLPVLKQAVIHDSEKIDIREQMVCKGQRLLEDPGYPDRIIAEALADILLPVLG